MARHAVRRAALLAIAPLWIALALAGFPSGPVHAALPVATMPIVLPTPMLASPALPLPTPKPPLPTPTLAQPTPTLARPTLALPTPTLALPTIALPMPTLALPTMALPTPTLALPTPSASPPSPTPEPSLEPSVVPSGPTLSRPTAPTRPVESTAGGAGIQPPSDRQGGTGPPADTGAGDPRHEVDRPEGASPLDSLMLVDVPSVTLRVSALLILAFVGAQIAGAISFLPIVRRQFGPGRAWRRRRD
jgi:hypothetical protein